MIEKELGDILVAGHSVSKSLLVVSNDVYDIYTDESEELVQSITVLKAGQRTRGHKHGHWETYHFEEAGLELYLNGLCRKIESPSTIEIAPKVHHVVYNHTDRDIAFRCTWLKSDVKKESVY